MVPPQVRTTFRRADTRWFQWLIAAIFTACSAGSLSAQTLSDHVMVGRGTLMTGIEYSHDSWDEYWEGSLKRRNDNLGTVTTEKATWVGDYGVRDRFNVLVYVPYVWTEASQGVLKGMRGFQDLTVGAKYLLFETSPEKNRIWQTFLVASAGLPMTDYTQDFLPLSIGLQTKSASGRLIVNLGLKEGWFFTGTTAYTFRDNTTLDRPFYFTDGQAFLTSEVNMPNVFDYAVSAGNRREGLMISVSFWHQDTLGGGDIRRQDMPFVSNNMDFDRVSASALYVLPIAIIKDLSVRVDAAHIVSGRNVGQSTTLAAGLFKTFHFQSRGRILP